MKSVFKVGLLLLLAGLFVWQNAYSFVPPSEETRKAGIFSGKDVTAYHQGNGLSHDRIRDIILDERGNLWFATPQQLIQFQCSIFHSRNRYLGLHIFHLLYI